MDLEFLFWYVLDGIKTGNIQIIIWLISSLFNFGFLLGLIRIVIEGEKVDY